jgi:hypothetical protein
MREIECVVVAQSCNKYTSVLHELVNIWKDIPGDGFVSVYVYKPPDNWLFLRTTEVLFKLWELCLGVT